MILDTTTLASPPDALGEPVNIVSFTATHGLHLEGQLVSLKPYSVCFQLYSPEVVLKTSEVLEDVNVHSASRSIYRGRATVKALTTTGNVTTCEAILEGGYKPFNLSRLEQPREFVRTGFDSFINYWSKFCRILPDYKSAVADLQCFLHDLKLWLDETELGVRAMPTGVRSEIERALVDELVRVAAPAMSSLFERFEIAASKVDQELLPPHFAYCRRELHPFLLTSPFMYRIFAKPLGYAGDYEMVDMILRNGCEGGSAFAKFLNGFILSQTPAVAHRNRVEYLTRTLVTEAQRRTSAELVCRVFNLGCGPAGEVQQFLQDYELSSHTQFTLLDSNQETIDYSSSKLREVSRKHGRRTPIKLIKKSVQQLLKQSGKPKGPEDEYDLVYSAGLFDYLNDRVCKFLIQECYSMLAPGGLLVVTNVDTSNPIRNIMEHLYDWYLIYRDGHQLTKLAAGLPGHPEMRVHADLTSSNLFLEIRRPQ